MTELDLYKFAQTQEIDWRGEKLYIWIRFCDLAEFTGMIGYDQFSEGGEEVSLQHDCICVDIVDICESYGIEPENIFPKET
ncbi:hypothetical protein [Rossellomorea vietnamensis]|uniref:hypothetical protein n=1 Tax=Rossellomorea vietnamensis TaxID=218284 RepID=UPI00055309F6|nr:hypothetical protein [Rossellomorea vietnamensis]